MHIPKAHICIAGITNREDQQAVALDIPNDGNHLLVFEYVVTNESLLGERPQSNLICTHLSEISALLERRPNVINLIRYETREPDSLVNQLRRISEYLGPELDGFQIETLWPDPNKLRCFLRMYPMKKMILKVGGEALAQVCQSKKRLLDRLSQYKGIFDDVQLNFTEGNGESFDPDMILNLLKTLHVLPFGFGISGKLGPENLHLCKQIFEEYPGVNISALRSLVNTNGKFSPTKAHAFFVAASAH
jgi:hypothetical protein